MRPKVKTWLECDGDLVFSNGRAGLLREIERLGSISAAAKTFGMSYRTAWTKLHHAEVALGFPLLETKAGGRGGGGASLTAEGAAFLEKFERFRAETEAAAIVVFSRIFTSS